MLIHYIITNHYYCTLPSVCWYIPFFGLYIKDNLSCKAPNTVHNFPQILTLYISLLMRQHPLWPCYLIICTSDMAKIFQNKHEYIFFSLLLSSAYLWELYSWEFKMLLWASPNTHIQTHIHLSLFSVILKNGR